MKFVAVVALTFLLVQVSLAAHAAVRMRRAPGIESSAALSSIMQSAAAQSAAALNSASTQLNAATQSASNSIPATKLESSIGEASLPGSSESSSSSKCVNCGGGDGMTVEDAVRPIDDWMKDFKSRTAGNGNDLMKAAKAAVRPLIEKLKRNQAAAMEKLEESNAAIVNRVEEQASQHVYNLLRAEHIQEVKAEKAEEKREKLQEVKAEAAEKEMETKLLAEHSESSKKL